MTVRRFECTIHRFVVAVEGMDVRVVSPRNRLGMGCSRCDAAVTEALAAARGSTCPYVVTSGEGTAHCALAEAETRRMRAVVDAAIAVAGPEYGPAVWGRLADLDRAVAAYREAP